MQEELKEKNEALWSHEKFFEETKEKMREEVVAEKTKLLEDRVWLIERSKEVLRNVQTTYQT